MFEEKKRKLNNDCFRKKVLFNEKSSEKMETNYYMTFSSVCKFAFLRMLMRLFLLLFLYLNHWMRMVFHFTKNGSYQIRRNECYAGQVECCLCSYSSVFTFSPIYMSTKKIHFNNFKMCAMHVFFFILIQVYFYYEESFSLKHSYLWNNT